jgi:hypothetical protein
MKGGGIVYPNKGVKIDPRSITSAKMPESLKVYSGYLKACYNCLMGEGMMKRSYVERENQKISDLMPYSQTANKFKSSHWFRTDTHIVEFFRTSEFNYKIYALQIAFIEESKLFLPTNETF